MTSNNFDLIILIDRSLVNADLGGLSTSAAARDTPSTDPDYSQRRRGRHPATYHANDNIQHSNYHMAHVDGETEHYDHSTDDQDHMAHVDLDQPEAEQNSGECNKA